MKKIYLTICTIACVALLMACGSKSDKVSQNGLSSHIDTELDQLEKFTDACLEIFVMSYKEGDFDIDETMESKYADLADSCSSSAKHLEALADQMTTEQLTRYFKNCCIIVGSAALLE